MKGAKILNIETSGDACSVCLSQEENVLDVQETIVQNSHAENIAPYIDIICKRNNLSSETLSAVSVSCGPGSYTGLRIGVSIAKSICYSWSLPLIGISTLEAMYNGIKSFSDASDYTLFCPMIDARRMEVYTAVYDIKGNLLLKEQPMVLDKNSFSNYNISQIIFFGSGAEKLKSVYPNIKTENFHASAKHLVALAYKKYNANLFAEVAYSEPNYIKPFYSAAQQRNL